MLGYTIWYEVNGRAFYTKAVDVVEAFRGLDDIDKMEAQAGLQQIDLAKWMGSLSRMERGEINACVDGKIRVFRDELAEDNGVPVQLRVLGFVAYEGACKVHIHTAIKEAAASMGAEVAEVAEALNLVSQLFSSIAEKVPASKCIAPTANEIAHIANLLRDNARGITDEE